MLCERCDGRCDVHVQGQVRRKISGVTQQMLDQPIEIHAVNEQGRCDGCLSGTISRSLSHFFRKPSCRLNQPKIDGACRWHTAQAKSKDLGLLALNTRLTPPPA